MPSESESSLEPFIAALENSIHRLETASLPGQLTDDLRKFADKYLAESDIVHLFDMAPDAILMINEDGNIIGMNHAVESIFGWTRLELLAKPVDVLVPDRLKCKHQEGKEAFFKNPVKTMPGYGLITFGKHKDGHDIPISIAFSFIKAGGETIGIAFVRLRKVG